MKYAHKTKFVRAIDGDTVVLLIDLGLKSYREEIIRLARVNTPELKDFDQKEAALKAKAFVTNFLARPAPIVVETKQQDPYGRWVGEVWCDGVNISDELLAAGLAVPYP